MLSLGTEVFFAFWMASYSVGLPPGSPPPVRAATSMFLISRANSLPRRASLTAFWCLVVAHLEWPLIKSPSRPISVLFDFLARRVYVDDRDGSPGDRPSGIRNPRRHRNGGPWFRSRRFGRTRRA